MKNDLTLSIIKPDSISKGYYSEILRTILNSNFRVVYLKSKVLSKNEAEEFYAIHKEKPFFDNLIKFMTSGEIYVLVLIKNNSIEDFRKLIGDTDPTKASAETIRRKFGESVEKNAIHGSDSDENAAIEGSFFFGGLEQN